ncbi:autotransporter domain-containing protein [Caulobacter sp. UNC279MFTsu5.1]|uniref:autotransporter domain-containing protein n=1 Tax=Caulobacter sp. UNC279MFTsu5.1 TaxID=1502775 RepID=UPI0008EF9818|nr:autotransporter domain-containing protein [Caulobacter sp. UNC279MFTsu5.1]SFI58733.1 autotransporter-associated beta strand repeat-containing protein [Caulobacter sp. UNC279MFTsu5.1]
MKVAKGRRNSRVLWLAGTALGCSLLVQPATALAADECGAPAGGVVSCPTPTTTGVSYTTIDDLILNLPAAASNTGATAVKVSGGAGDIGVVAADISSSGNSAPGLVVSTTSGAIDIDLARAVTTGTSYGADTNDAVVAVSNSGAIKVKAGEVSTAGVYTSGVAAVSGIGDVSIEIDRVYSSGLGGGIVQAQSYTGPVGAPTEGGRVTVVVGEAEVTRPNGVIGAYAYGDVSVTAGKIIANGAPETGPSGTVYGQGIGARSYNGDVNVKVDDLSTSGVGFLGVSVRADAGDASVESGTVTAASDGAYGIYVRAGGTAKVVSDATTTHGKVTNDGTTHYTDAIRVEAAGLMDVTSQHATATGDGASAILARGDGSIRIDSGEASASGGAITVGGVQVFSNAISAQSFLGDIDISSDTASAQGVQSWAIYASAGNGAISIDSGTATAAGAGGRAIYANGGEGVTIRSDVASTTGGPSGSNAADAIMALTFNKTADIDITSGSASTTGNGARGIYAWTTGGITIDSGQVTTTGNSAHGIMVDSDGAVVFGTPHVPAGGVGTLSIVSDKVSATGAGATGIWADYAGPITIDSGEITVGNGVGLYVYGKDTVDVSADKVTADGTGVVVYGREGAVHVTTGTVSAGTQGDVGIFAQTTSGDIVISAQTTKTQGDILTGFTADAVGGISTSGDISITSGDAQTTGRSAFGAYAISQTGTVSIDSGSVTTAGQDSTGLYTRGASASIESGSVHTSGDAARGIYAWSNGDIDIHSGEVATTGANAHGIMVDSDGALVFGTPHVPAGGAGTLSIVSDKVSATGVGAMGVWADYAGPISIDAGEITVGNGVGLYVYGQNAVDVVVDKVTAMGTGVAVYGREGAVNVTTGTVSAGVQGDVGVFAQSTTGDVTINANITRTANTGLHDGFTADGVGGYSTNGGHVKITSVDSAVVGQYASAVWGKSTGGEVEINSGKARAASDGTVAVSGRGDKVTIVSQDAEITGANARAINAVANDSGDLFVTSSRAVATGTGSIAIDVFANHDATLTVTGQTSGAMGGVRVSALNQAEMTVGADASITATSGVGVEFRAVPAPGGSGSPAAGYGAGLTTAGHIGGAPGALAVQFAGGDDTLTLLTGASFTGAIDGGAGLDALMLKGTSNQQSAAQTFGGVLNFETASVETGDWTLTGVLQADTIDIAQGATLLIDDKQEAGASLETTTPGAGLSVYNDGTLISRSFDDNLYADSGTLSISGAGDVELQSGAMLATGAWTYTGATRVSGGELHVVNAIGGGLEQTGGGVVVGAAYGVDDAGLGTVKVVGHGTTGGFAGGLKVDGGQFFLGQDGDYTLANALSGSGGEVIWAGGGDLTLAGAYSRTGTLVNEGGVVTIANLSADSRLALTGEAFALGSGAKKTGGLSGDADLDIGAGTLMIAQINASIYSGDLSGAGGLVKSGAATLTLSGAATYAGPTTVSGGTLLLEGSMTSDVIVASGATLQIGDGGTTGALTGDLAVAGTAVFNRSDEYDYGGDITGAGELVKKGASRLTLSGQYGFTGTTTVQGGSVRILHLPETAQVQVDNGVLDLSGLTQTITNLSGGTTGGVDISGGALTVNQSGSTTFAGSITGSGSFTVTGGGVIELSGTNTYTGDTTVTAGKLKVNGTVTSDVTVGAAGALGGSGVIGGDVVVQGGGQVTPGNSPGTLTVAGDFTFATGSTYQVEVLPTGEHDLIVVGRATTIQTGAKVAVLAGGPASQYARLSQYGILTSAGGITGRFSSVTSDMAFLTPSLTYTANAVRLNLLRNDIRFASFATTSNQARVADAAEALGLGAPVYDALVTQNAGGSAQGYAALDGQIYADVSTVLAGEAGRLRQAIQARTSAPAEVSGGWGDVLAGWSKVDASAGAAGLKVSGAGLVAGGDKVLGDTRLGLAAAYGEADGTVSARGSRAESKNGQVAAYAASVFGPLRADVGAAYAWSSIDAERAVVFPGNQNRVKGKYDATIGQVFGQVSAPVTLGAAVVEPFVAASYLRVKSDSFNETGGFAALKVEGVTRELGLIDVGVKVRGQFEVGGASVLRPRAAVAWRMATGDLAGQTANAFTSGTTRFVISGAKYDAGALAVQLGADLVSGDRARFGVTYEGTYGDRFEAQAVRAGGSWRF